MRTVFLGTPRAAVPCLRALAAGAHAPAAVICQPDRPAGRGRGLVAPPVKGAALELGLPVLQPETTVGAALRAEVAAFRPDALVVVAYGRILGPRFLSLARHGAVNVHFSLLPRWRGAAPVQRALLAGDSETGACTMRLVEELDAGPVYEREAVRVVPGEHAPSLEARLAEAGARLLLSTLDAIEGGTARAEPQDESRVTLAPPLSKGEGWMDPARPAEELERQVRALDPWPGTWLTLPDGSALGVLDARAGEGASGAACGTFLPPRGRLVPVACGRGTVLELVSVKPAGKAAMSARSAVNGRIVRTGDVARAAPGGAAGGDAA